MISSRTTSPIKSFQFMLKGFEVNPICSQCVLSLIKGLLYTVCLAVGICTTWIALLVLTEGSIKSRVTWVLLQQLWQAGTFPSVPTPFIFCL